MPENPEPSNPVIAPRAVIVTVATCQRLTAQWKQAQRLGHLQVHVILSEESHQ